MDVDYSGDCLLLQREYYIDISRIVIIIIIIWICSVRIVSGPKGVILWSARERIDKAKCETREPHGLCSIFIAGLY